MPRPPATRASRSTQQLEGSARVPRGRACSEAGQEAADGGPCELPHCAWDLLRACEHLHAPTTVPRPSLASLAGKSLAHSFVCVRAPGGRRANSSSCLPLDGRQAQPLRGAHGLCASGHHAAAVVLQQTYPCLCCPSYGGSETRQAAHDCLTNHRACEPTCYTISSACCRCTYVHAWAWPSGSRPMAGLLNLFKECCSGLSIGGVALLGTAEELTIGDRRFRVVKQVRSVGSRSRQACAMSPPGDADVFSEASARSIRAACSWERVATPLST
jgi:hypothetical protein